MFFILISQQYTMEDCPFNKEAKEITNINIGKIGIPNLSNGDSNTKLPDITSKPVKEKKKSGKKICNHPECKKKLSLVDTTMGGCKCEQFFCSLHRDPESHQCSYDWHNTKKNELAKILNSNKCVASKLTAI